MHHVLMNKRNKQNTVGLRGPVMRMEEESDRATAWVASRRTSNSSVFRRCAAVGENNDICHDYIGPTDNEPPHTACPLNKQHHDISYKQFQRKLEPHLFGNQATFSLECFTKTVISKL